MNSFADLPMRHPDHYYCGEIVRECCYLAGLEKIKSESPPFRPSAFIGFPELIIPKRPDFVIDITPFWQKRQEVIRCYDTQVIEPGTEDKSSKTFV